MAKRRKKSAATKTRTITRTVAAKAPIIRVSAPSPVMRMRRRARKAVRRAGAVVGSTGKKILGVGQNQLVAIGAAAGLAYLQKSGVKVPKLIGSLNTPANAGLIAFGAGYLLKNQMLSHVATGLLSAGAYAYASGAPIQGDVMGEGRAVVFGDDLEGEDLEGDYED